MRRKVGYPFLVPVLLLGLLAWSPKLMSGGKQSTKGPTTAKPRFQTSDRCMACHNGLTTPSGEDISIGFDWRSSMMANSSRDPYWQGPARRGRLGYSRRQGAN